MGVVSDISVASASSEIMGMLHSASSYLAANEGQYGKFHDDNDDDNDNEHE